jgi:hypothetical protein
VVNADENFEVSLDIENVGGQPGRELFIIQSRRATETQWTEETSIGIELDPGESTTRVSKLTAPPAEVTLEFRIPGFDTGWSTDVTTGNATPGILQFALVSDWSQYGDVIVNEIREAAAGDDITFGVRHETFVHSGTYDTTVQVEVYDADTGDLLGRRVNDGATLTDGAGYREWESSVPFSTRDRGSGQYRAEATVRDDISREVSGSEATSFELQ